jgi:hypothetical protein
MCFSYLSIILFTFLILECISHGQSKRVVPDFSFLDHVAQAGYQDVGPLY